MKQSKHKHKTQVRHKNEWQILCYQNRVWLTISCLLFEMVQLFGKMIMIQSGSYETKDTIETNKRTKQNKMFMYLSVYLFCGAQQQQKLKVASLQHRIKWKYGNGGTLKFMHSHHLLRSRMFNDQPPLVHCEHEVRGLSVEMQMFN